MPTLTIDNQTITVPEGENVLEAARALGIVIPHFCYHEALGAVGACRLCAMKFEDGPVKGIQMSCMILAKDGMVVSTVDPEAAEMRRHLIEWLMMNHPHDCPVCDEGGECQLQEMTIAGGHGIRRYRGKKRTWINQDLGPFVEQEMNRCIQCYRCVRTYQDYCGGDDFGVMGSRDRLFFGRFRDGALQSPFSGNIIDVCPTGVFTSRPFRFRSRSWDLEEADSICPHCSLGCAVVPGARYRQVQRVRAGVNRQTNGFFICDRGRFGYGYVNHPQRPRTPLVDGREATWEEALGAAGRRIESLVAQHGPQSVAFLGSSRASLEANALLREWARTLGTPHLVFESHPERDRAARAATLLGEKSCSLEEIRRSDLAILIGCDPASEAPMLGLALRQAVRSGGQVAAVDPRPILLPFPASRLPLHPERLPTLLSALSGGSLDAFSRAEALFVEGLRQRLAAAKRPVLIGGADLLGEAGVQAFAATVTALCREERPCAGMVTLSGPNSFGGALLSGAAPDFSNLLDAMQEGTIKALITLQADPFLDSGDPGAVEAALPHLELLVALDCTPTETMRRAHIFLPTTTLVEESGTLINNEGRLLPYRQVFSPGTPIAVTGDGDHPPRTFETGTPGDAPRPAWSILGRLQGADDSLEEIRGRLAAADLRLSPLTALPAEGERVRGIGALAAPPAVPLPICRPAGTLALYVVESFVGSGLLESLSAVLDPLRRPAEIHLNSDDAEGLGISDGEAVTLTTVLGRQGVTARTSSALPAGIAILPRLRGSALAPFVPGTRHLYGTVSSGGRP
ncbi:NADH dehydrogenase subunit G [Desulfuromonas soudanensis]|uniref:NADH dehydrogenase subunit G n=1 Tax=Desulfuromonas soudanensis TaxID=1603606 RepID=A0A0M4DKN5_9BACT|nr:NADH-quinone oxidoreductase subunit NuoG [Desulfuromonas soudanensis]ALC18125.1 NADH dehydrogenase subunit G [Desulfuromonas soudanensis]